MNEEYIRIAIPIGKIQEKIVSSVINNERIDLFLRKKIDDFWNGLSRTEQRNLIIEGIALIFEKYKLRDLDEIRKLIKKEK